MGLFGTAGIRGDSGDKVNLDFCSRMGGALSFHFSSNGHDRIVCGCDGRTSSQALKMSLTSSILYHGLDVIDIGVVPTPILAFASSTERCPGVMVTASHNPPKDNGVKVFTSGLEIGMGEEEDIERMFHGKGPFRYDWQTCGRYRMADYVGSYIKSLAGFVRACCGVPDLGGMRVLLDSGNGVGALVTVGLLNRLGANVDVVNSHLSGLFPGRSSEPSLRNLEQTIGYASATCPEIIIAQDGDADRVNVISKDMELVPEDTLLAFFSDLYSKEGDTVVLSIDTSLRSDRVLSERGVKVVRVPLGYLHDGIRKYGPSFAGEPWKHIHMPFGPWIDGIASCAILTALVKKNDHADLFSSIPSFHQLKRNIDIVEGTNTDMLVEKAKLALTGLYGVREVISTSGVRVNFDDDSWVLIRPSGTEPKIRVIVEGTTKERFNELQGIVDRILEDYI